jgi:DNA repair protein RecO (recombination protein O)
MTAPKVYKTEAIVLKHINLKEADRILTLYTPNQGKISAVAKGVRRPRSKMGGHLELLTHCSMMLTRGRNMDTVNQVQTASSFRPLREDLWREGLALYAAELVTQFTAEHQENYQIYRLLLDTLNRLCDTKDGELILRFFEVNLLTHLGYKPELHQCINCKKPLEPTANYFSASGGGVLCPSCRSREQIARPISLNALKVLRLCQQGDYSKVSKVNVDDELSAEIEGILRQYIRYLLEREVKSVTWLDRLRRES